jgi:hypothetical protein
MRPDGPIAVQLGPTSYLPTFVQDVLGTGAPLVAGSAWPGGSGPAAADRRRRDGQRRARTAIAIAQLHPAATIGVSSGSKPPGRTRTRSQRSLR